jgi:signal transduction histidine kinase
MPRLPPMTVRLRLTLLYGGLFFLSGLVLLAVSYLIFRGATGVNLIVQPGAPGTGGAAQSRELAERAYAASVERNTDALHSGLFRSLAVLAALTVISIALGWLVAGRVLRPLRTMTATTRQISERNLNERLALPGPRDELRELADTIDGLLARLQAAFDAQRQFVANASHELRSPLTEERTILEVALADPAATAATLRSACEEVLEANQEQEQLIESLLTLARSQRGLDHREPFDLADVTTRLLDARRRQAQAGGLSINAALTPAPATGDPGLAERLVANLVDNALRYNIPGGRVEVMTRTRDGHAILSVANTGPAVPGGQVQRLLQPFQRLSPDRTGAPGGSGLGLSIVAAIAKAHGAIISARPGNEGGLDIEVIFATPAPGVTCD